MDILGGTPTPILKVFCQPSQGNSQVDPEQEAQMREELAIADEAQGWPTNPSIESPVGASLMSVVGRTSCEAEHIAALEELLPAQWNELIVGIFKGNPLFDEMRAYLPGGDLGPAEQLALIIRQLSPDARGVAISTLDQIDALEVRESVDALKKLLA